LELNLGKVASQEFAMTTLTLNPVSNVMHAIARPFFGLQAFVSQIDNAYRLAALSSTLYAASDKELSARGLKREEIGQHLVKQM
jgi:hypothetical protein